MFEKQKGAMTLFCDECDSELDEKFSRGEFQEMIEEAKRTGWRIAPDADKDDGWSHICEDCSQSTSSRLAQAQKLFGG